MALPESPRLHLKVRLQALDTKAGTLTYLLTSPSGRRWEIPESCYRFLLLLDGQHSMADLQRELDTGRYSGLSGCCVTEVFEKFVLDCGLLESAGETADDQKVSKRPSRLTLAIPLIRSARLAPLTRLFYRAFDRKWVIAILTAGTILQIASWYILKARWTAAPQPYTSRDLTVFFLIILLCGPIHELGHLSAAHRYKCATGNLGIGCYLFFPVMYVDLSAAWTLPRYQRIIVNIGGLYFQLAGAAILAAIHLVCAKVVFGILALLYISLAAVNINPLLKLDGYWCLSDALGIPNLHRRARAAVWHELAAAVGQRVRTSGFAYQGHRKIFLVVLGAAHLLYVGLVFAVAGALLLTAQRWLHPHGWANLFSTLASKPFTHQWLEASRREIGKLLAYIGLLVMLGRATVMAARKLLISGKFRLKTGKGSHKPVDLPSETLIS